MDTSRDTTLRAIADRLRLTRPLAFLDLETTGVSPESDRIVEIAIVTVFPDGRVTRLERFVHPEMPIPPSASAVHGIHDADVATAPTFRAMARELAEVLAGCDFAGYNVIKFDLKLLSAEFTRAGIDLRIGEARVIDAMAIYHRNERRDLEAAVRFYNGRDHRGHRATEDVDATIDVLHAQLERYSALPRDVTELSDYCNGRQPDWLTTDGRIVWRDGAARITFGKHAGKSLHTLLQEDRGYLQWILQKDFPPDLKRVISEALDGQMPAEPK